PRAQGARRIQRKMGIAAAKDLQRMRSLCVGHDSKEPLSVGACRGPHERKSSLAIRAWIGSHAREIGAKFEFRRRSRRSNEKASKPHFFTRLGCRVVSIVQPQRDGRLEN